MFKTDGILIRLDQKVRCSFEPRSGNGNDISLHKIPVAMADDDKIIFHDVFTFAGLVKQAVFQA